MKALFLTLLFTTVIATSAELTTIRGVACVTSDDPKIPAYPVGTLAYEYKIDDIAHLNEQLELDLALYIYVCARTQDSYGWLLIPAPRPLFAYMQRAYKENRKEWKTKGFWGTRTLENQQQKYVYDIQYAAKLKKFLTRKEYSEWKLGKTVTTYTKLDLGSEKGYHTLGYQILKLTFNQNQILSATID